MKTAAAFFVLCLGMVTFSIVLAARLSDAEATYDAPFQWWIQVLLLATWFYGILRFRRSFREKARINKRLALACVLLLVVLVGPVVAYVGPLRNSFPSLGRTPEGQPIFKKTWSREGDHYYVRLNHEAPVEVSAAEFQSLERQMALVFARGWVLFWYLGAVLWSVVLLRERGAKHET